MFDNHQKLNVEEKKPRSRNDTGSGGPRSGPGGDGGMMGRPNNQIGNSSGGRVGQPGSAPRGGSGMRGRGNGNFNRGDGGAGGQGGGRGGNMNNGNNRGGYSGRRQ